MHQAVFSHFILNVLFEQFLSLWENRPLLADLYALSIHRLLKCESKWNMYCELTADFLNLDRN